MAGHPYDTLTLFSASWCPDCRQARRFLDEHGVEYDLIEIDRNPEAARQLEGKTGKRGIPYLVLHTGQGEEWVRAYVPRQGFDREGLRELLGL